MNLNKEVKVGFLVVITLTIGYLGFNFLKGKELFPTTKEYYAIYENSRGLNTANEVLLNGFKVGRIKCLRMLPEEKYKILVTLAIDKHIKLTDTSVARLENTNLLGNKAIELIIKEGNLLKQHDTLLTETEQDLSTRFAESTLPALDDAKSITLLTNKFIQNLVENTDRINSIFNNLEQTTYQLRKTVNLNERNLSIISRNLVEVSKSLSDPATGIGPFLSQLKNITDEIEDMKLKQLAMKLNGILSTIEEQYLYGRFEQTLANLDKLLIDLRTNPNRYVHFSIFGANSIFSSNKKKLMSTTNNNVNPSQ